VWRLPRYAARYWSRQLAPIRSGCRQLPDDMTKAIAGAFLATGTFQNGKLFFAPFWPNRSRLWTKLKN